VKLFEYQAKELLKEYGIPVPESELAHNQGEAVAAFRGMSHPVVLKSQVLAGGRGKAGGILAASNEEEVTEAFGKIMNLEIGGERPSCVLVEVSVSHETEIYFSITLDRGARAFVVISSKAGGVDVESLKGRVIQKISNKGITKGEAQSVAMKLHLSGEERERFSRIVANLERLAREKECELAEINPLAFTKRGGLMALDAKVILDDNALFRHPEFSKLHPEDEFEGEASRQGFAFVRLEGNIGVVGNGAGLVLSTLDLVADAGGNPACFLDLGGGAQRERVEAAVNLVNKLPNANRILVNIFGGITRTTDVAEGIKSVIEQGVMKPIYARISGAEEREAREILAKTPVHLYPSPSEAVEAAVRSQ